MFAVLSEIPFDLMYGGMMFYPFHQNVIWTLLLGLTGVHLMEKAKGRQKTGVYVLVAMVVTVVWVLLGTICMVDYYGAGILTIFTFYKPSEEYAELLGRW